MRISDWSSDVCSSDLGRGAGAVAGYRPSGAGHADRPARAACNSLVLPAAAFALAVPLPAGEHAGTGGGGVDRAARPPEGRHDSLRSVARGRSEEHTSELQSLMRISYAVFCLKKKKNNSQLGMNIHTIPSTYTE